MSENRKMHDKKASLPSKKNAARNVPGASYQNTKGQFKGSAPSGKPHAKIDV